MTSAETLALAQHLLDGPDSKTVGLWPRAAALLARQALEQALDAFWKGRGLSLGSLSTRPQLICLPKYLDDQALATSLRYAWTALTHACHHHPYEFAPTRIELAAWISAVARFSQEEGSGAG